MTDENEPGKGQPDNSNLPENPTNTNEGGENIVPTGELSQPAWVESLTDDDKKVLSDKGFKSPADLIKSYREMEKLSGNKFSIPEGDDAEGWSKLYARLGRPETVDGYEMKDVREVDVTAVAEFKETCLKSNILPKQATALYDWYKQNQDKLDEQFTAQSEKEKNETFQSWGNDLAKNQEVMRRGVSVLGLDEKLLENIEMAIGTKQFMEMGLRIGNGISEDTAKGLSTGASVKTEKMTPVDFYEEVLNRNNKP